MTEFFKAAANVLPLMSESPRQEADSSAPGPDKELSECPTCGRDDFKNNNGMRQHHAEKHGESLSKVTVECVVCGDEYKVHHSEVERTRTCSRECHGADPNNGQTENKVELECLNCGKTIRRSPSQAESRDKSFCSHECHGEWMNGENHHQWKGGPVTVECSWCGEETTSRIHRAENQEKNFCDPECYTNWISENRVGENHHLWKEGTKHNYGGGWSKQREKALERDGYECRACGMPNETHKEKYGKSLHVHHIIRAGDFDDLENAHSLENLVTACHNCHAKFEGLPVFPDCREAYTRD